MTDKEIAGKIKHAAAALADAIEFGASMGIETTLEVIPVSRVSNIESFVITAHTSKVL